MWRPSFRSATGIVPISPLDPRPLTRSLLRLVLKPQLQWNEASAGNGLADGSRLHTRYTVTYPPVNPLANMYTCKNECLHVNKIVYRYKCHMLKNKKWSIIIPSCECCDSTAIPVTVVAFIEFHSFTAIFHSFTAMSAFSLVNSFTFYYNNYINSV